MTSPELFPEYAACLGRDAERPVFVPGPVEQWRAIPGYEGKYEAGESGRVRSVEGAFPGRAAGVMESSTSRYGYHGVGLWLDGQRRHHTVHSLVASAFIGPRPLGAVVDHLDGDRANNAPSNLEYVTQAENVRRAARAGRLAFANRSCGRCKQKGHNRRQYMAGISEVSL